jgi:hypothetical protein
MYAGLCEFYNSFYFTVCYRWKSTGLFAFSGLATISRCVQLAFSIGRRGHAIVVSDELHHSFESHWSQKHEVS